jgi:hypothetical protein
LTPKRLADFKNKILPGWKTILQRKDWAMGPRHIIFNVKTLLGTILAEMAAL